MDFLFSCNICVIIDAATCCVEGYLAECKRNLEWKLKIFCKKLSIEEVEYNLKSFKNWRILFNSIILTFRGRYFPKSSLSRLKKRKNTRGGAASREESSVIGDSLVLDIQRDLYECSDEMEESTES